MKGKLEIPKEWVMSNETYGLNGETYKVPSCPNCDEPTYSEKICGVCGQHLKDPKEIER